jgi:LPS export ABC transporter protein LptC
MVLIGMLFSCGNTKEEIQRITFTEDFPDETTRNAEIRYSDSAKAKVLMKAPLINRFTSGSETYTEMPEGMHVIFYTDSGTVDSEITSNYARYYPNDKYIEAKYNVIVKNSEGDILSTEHLIWEMETEQIRSREFVKITTGDEIIYGDGLVANQDFTKYEISHIKGIISVSEQAQDTLNEDL